MDKETGLWLLWLLICIVLILGLAYWVTRRLGAGGIFPGCGTGRLDLEMEVLARLPVGRDRALLVVRVDQRYLLLGDTPGGISMLSEFAPDEAQRWQQRKRGPVPQGDFRKTLRELLEQKERR